MIWVFVMLYILPFALLTVLVEAEWFGTATTAMLAAMGIYGFLHRTEVIPYVKDHAVFCLEFLVVYLAMGVAWSFAKWLLFLLKFRSKFRNIKEAYVIKLGLPKGADVPDDKLENFKDSLRYTNVNGYVLTSVPSAAYSKSKIVAWMAFWPCSMFGYVLNDPVKRLFNAIFVALKQSYQKMADSIVNDPELK